MFRPTGIVSPDQVPTWLYQAVHLTGTVRKLSEHELGPHLDALSAKFENWLAPKPPWTIVEDDGGAAGGDEEGDRGSGDDGRGGRGQFQAQPAKSDVDYVAIASALMQQHDEAAQTIGKQMVALRPQLDYKSSTPASASAD